MRKRKTMLDNKPAFTKDQFKYIFVLTALAWMTYTLPSVQAMFDTAQSYDGSESLAASITSPVGDFLAALVGRGPERRDMKGALQPGSTTQPRFQQGLGSSTPNGRPMPQRGGDEDRSKGPKPLPPQEVVNILVKLGYIPADNADAAHKALEQYLKERASSTPSFNREIDDDMRDIRKELKARASSTRPLPPMPPVSGTVPTTADQQLVP